MSNMEAQTPQQNNSTLISTDLATKSPAIRRIIEEVRNKETLQGVRGNYDRTHNRHNRGSNI